MIIPLKTAIVTGANRGIGLEICRQLAQANWQVVLTCRHRPRGEQALESLGEERQKITVMELDITDSEAIKPLIDEVFHRFGRIDVLINNAGIFEDRDIGMENIGLERFKATMETNFYGALLMSQAVVPTMKAQRFGRIINLSSGLGALHSMGAGYPAYRVSKAALNAMTAILAAELAEFGVQVNSMCPGWVQTEMGGAGAPRTIEQGADTAIWLATATEIPNGKFLRDRQIIEW